MIVEFNAQTSAAARGAALIPFGPLQPFVAAGAVCDAAAAAREGARVDVAVASHRLQNLADYRQAIRDWFDTVLPGGHLIITVPHAFLHDRQLSLPSPWSREQRRLYTPGSLAQEVEEALPPNSYRVRWLGDLDEGYDYDLPPEMKPIGDAALAVVLEKIAPPTWPIRRDPVTPPLDPPREPFAFEPVRTRVELATGAAVRRILILKLDHLGDFIMGLPALERARGYFADAEITLVVGSWNAVMAGELGVADRIIAFDAFPRNSSEQEPNVEATMDLFRTVVTENYDLAIDMRVDFDTRTLLKVVSAPIKAGIGTRSRFPFLDIALPLDSTRNEAERAAEWRLTPDRFVAQGSATRRHFGIHSDRTTVERDCAIIWGPFLELNPGDYIFDFYIDLDQDRGGLIKLDIALDQGPTVTEQTVSRSEKYHLGFHVEKPGTSFEARVWTVEDHESLDFIFYGGLLIKKGPGDVLHQTEYYLLLIELVKLRIAERGLLIDAGKL